MMTATTKPSEKPGDAAKQPAKKKKVNWKFLSGAVAGAAVVGVLLFRSCGPAEEPIRTETPAEDCVRAPEKGDGNCETSKGEHDPFSPNFDPESCGFCGDGVQTVWLVAGDEVGRETADSCLADFACGHPGVGMNTTVAVIDEVASDEGVAYRYNVREAVSCAEDAPNYCEQLCQPVEEEPAPAKTPRKRGKRADRPTKTSSVERPSGGGPGACPGSVTGSHSAQMLKRRVSGNVLSKGHPLRNEMSAGDNNVMVTIVASVSSGGSVSVRSASARCFGSCGTSSLSGGSLTGILGDIGLNGATIDAPGETCAWTIRVPISAGR